MNPRALYLTAVAIGSTLGGFVPMLWGDGGLSGWAIITSGIGGILALWLTHRYLV